MTSADIAAALNLVGALFRVDPAAAALQPVLAGLANGALAADWPWPHEEVDAAFAAMAPFAAERAEARAALHAAFMDLFVGPDQLAAPPWGSVYLDEEKVLFGASTSALSLFLDRHAIAFGDAKEGPVDHFGTLCWIGAWLASKDRMDVFDELLGEHVLPWAPLYLDELATAALAMTPENPAAGFYAAASRIAHAALAALQSERSLTVPARTLYPGRTARPQ
jgi:putative dimethyl sulfoxide reductase chaperone